MKIAVIGTGRMGSALAARFAAAGHDVRIGSRDADRGAEAATRTGARFGGTVAAAALDAEVVALAVPWAALPETLVELGSLDDVVLVDVTNPFRAGSATELVDLQGASGAERLRELVPHARVVKAWNHLYSAVVRGSASFDGTAASIFVASDDEDAKRIVCGLARELGFEPVDAGPLVTARYLEPLAALMTTLDRVSPDGSLHALRVLERARARKGAARVSVTA